MTPNPGSYEANALGCKCPTFDNRHGLGLYTDADGIAQFVINGDCPIHAKAFEAISKEFEQRVKNTRED